jgi:hypothetical protein
MSLLERAAQASGGPRAADLLVQAAQVATEVFQDVLRALLLVERAHQADPHNLPALRGLADSYRQRGEVEPLIPVLRGLVAGTPQGEESAALKLELARLLLQRGETDEARGLLEPLAAGGCPPRLPEALELLVPCSRAPTTHSPAPPYSPPAPSWRRGPSGPGCSTRPPAPRSRPVTRPAPPGSPGVRWPPRRARMRCCCWPA